MQRPVYPPYDKSRYKKLKTFYEKTLKPGSETPFNYIQHARELAYWEKEKGQDKEAIKIYEKILEIMRHNQNCNTFMYLWTLEDLSRLYFNEYDYEKAELLYKEIVSIYKEDLQDGGFLLEYWQYCSIFAGVLELQGKYNKAISIYQEILVSVKKVVGTLHPDYIHRLNELAACYNNKGEYGKAEECYQKSLELVYHVLGSHHFIYGAVANKMADVYFNQGRYPEAEKFLQISLRIIGLKCGRNSERYAIISNKLGVLYSRQSRYKEAEIAFLKTLEIYKELLGEKHQDYLIVLDNLKKLSLMQEQDN
jgi:tetratricopeptide (TPR) repeat protein